MTFSAAAPHDGSRQHTPSAPARAARRTLLLLLLVAAGCTREPHDGEPKTAVVATVRTTTIDRGEVVSRIATVGTAELDASRIVTRAFVRAGQVGEVRVVAGQSVASNDVLLTLGAVPAGSLDAQKAAIDVDYATREVARVERLQKEKLATNQDLQNAQKDLAATRATLAALGGGAAAIALRAPSDGIVADVLVKAGAIVQAGQDAVTLAARDAIVVRAGFAVEDRDRLRVGTPVSLAPVFAAGNAPPSIATIERLRAIASPSTQLVEAIIRVHDPPAWLFAGVRAHVVADVASRDDALRIPDGALVERGGRRGAFAVAEEHASWHALELGIAGEGYVELLGGLAANDVVVTAGRSALEDGMKVRLDRAGDPP